MRVFALLANYSDDPTAPALFTTHEGAERYANAIELSDYTIEECEVKHYEGGLGK